MTWLIAGISAAYGLGASVVAMWYGGATIAPKSRRHLGAVNSKSSLMWLAARVYLQWWYLALGAYLRAARRRRLAKEAL